MGVAAQVKGRPVVITGGRDDQCVLLPVPNRVTHPSWVGILRQTTAIGKNLAEEGLVFVQENHEIRRLNDLDRGADRNAGLRTGRQTIDAVRVVSEIIRASSVKGRRPRLYVLRLEIRHGVEQIALVDPPNAGKIRLAICGSRCGGGEVGLAIGCSGHSRSWATRPLRCKRRKRCGKDDQASKCSHLRASYQSYW